MYVQVKYVQIRNEKIKISECGEWIMYYSCVFHRAGRYDPKFISRYFSKLYRFHGI